MSLGKGEAVDVEGLNCGDDIFVHTNLKKLFDWEKEGFILCGIATNGSEALRIIEEENPAIVITDMNMPGMDGVALIKQIQEKYPQIKVIALSAYDDFEYVKQSLKMGAVDYILKHTLTPEILRDILESAQQAILLDKREGAESEKIEAQIKTGKTVLTQNFIRILVKEGITKKEQAERELDFLDLKLDSKNLMVVAGEIDDYVLLKEKYSVSELSYFMQSFMDMAAEILKDYEKSVLTILEEGKFVIIFSFADLHSNQIIFTRVFSAITRIKTTLKRYLNITACFGMDGICRDLTQVSQYYRKAELLLSKKFYEGKDRIFHDPSIGEVNRIFHLEIKEEKNILEFIKSLQRDKLKNHVDDIFKKIQDYQPDLSSTKMVFVTMLNIANKVAGDSGIDPATIYGETQDPYIQLEKHETIQEVKEWILEVYEKLLNMLELFRLNPEYDGVTKKAIEYIYRNYRENISLQDIADYTGVNSSYLSRKFKKDCGKGVVEYLNLLRIEQAKMLMENGPKKVKEIADEVGFSNYNYFFKVFKDIQGMTPLEYEKSCRGALLKKFEVGS